MIYLTRRAFIKAGAIGAAGCTILSRMEKYLHALEKSGDIYSFQREMNPFIAIPSICHQCGAGCGILGLAVDDELVGILGNPAYPSSRGAICTRAASILNLVYDTNRVLKPLKRNGKRGGSKWATISWEQAMKEIGEKFGEQRSKEIIMQTGADEGYTQAADILNRLGNFILIDDTANENITRKKGHELVWGEAEGVPDVASSRYILNFGSNPYESHDLYIPFVKKLIQGRVDNNAKFVTFDVRLSNTAGKSDEWFPVRPGTDAAVILAMCNVILSGGLADESSLVQCAGSGAGQLLYNLKAFTPEFAQAESGVPAEDIKRIAIEFAARKPCVAFCGGGLTDNSRGINNLAAVFLLNAITGSIDSKGGYCLPRRYKFNQPALKTSALDIASLYNEGKQEPGIYISYLSNPVYRDASGGRIRKVLESDGILPYYIAVDTHVTETSMYADIILPAATHLESWGLDSRPSVNLVPYLGLRRPVIKPLGESRSLSDILAMIAKTTSANPAISEKSYIENYVREFSVPQGGAAESIWKKGYAADAASKPSYGTYRYTGFRTGSGRMNIQSAFDYQSSPKKADIGKGKLYFTGYTRNVSSRLNPNSKWLTEISHENPLMLNTGTAKSLGIKTGDTVEVRSNGTTLKMKAHVTEAVHPEAAAAAREHGHWGYGNFARGRKAETGDDDTSLVWWNNGKSHHIEKLFEDDINFALGSKVRLNSIVTIKKG